MKPVWAIPHPPSLHPPPTLSLSAWFSRWIKQGKFPPPLIHALSCSLSVYSYTKKEEEVGGENPPPPSTVRMVVCRGGNVTAILVSVGFMSYRFDLFNSYWLKPLVCGWGGGCRKCQHPLKFEIWIAKLIHFYPLKIFFTNPRWIAELNIIRFYNKLDSPLAF